MFPPFRPSTAEMVGDVHIYDPAMPVAAAMTTSVQHIDIVPQRYCGTCSELSVIMIMLGVGYFLEFHSYINLSA